MRRATPVLALALLGACTAGPDYAGPRELGSAAPAGQFARAGDSTSAEAPALAEWWTALNDPVLDQLEATALHDNPNIAVAQARVGQARANVRLERANRLPSLAASAMYAHADLPGVNLGQSGSGSTSGQDERTTLDFFNLGLNANWEIDFAGGQRRTIEAANAQEAAAVANVADAQVQLTAELAQAYVNLRERQNRLALLRRVEALQVDEVAVAGQRLARGTAAVFPLEQAKSQLAATRSDITAADAEREIYLDAVTVLAGSAPGMLDAQLDPVAPVPLPPASVAIGDPGALLKRRPDIRAAERKIAAATARIGVAEAARYPRLSFMGILGLGGSTLSALFDPSNISAIALPQLQWSFLDFGRNSARVSQSEAARDEAEAQYRQVVLSALQDAEDSLSRFGHQRQTVAQLGEIAASARRTADLMGQRYRAGVIGKGDTLEADRQALLAERNLQTASAALTGSFIAVEKALGIGWSSPVGGQ